MIHVIENHICGGLGEAAGCAFTLIQAGHLAPSGDHICTFGNYNCWHVVTGGNGYIKCNGKIHPLKTGDVFSVMYGCTIEYGAADGKEWSFIFLRIEGEKAPEMTKRMGLDRDNPVLAGGGEKMVELFKKLLAASREKEMCAEEYALMILRIVCYFTSALPAKPRTKAQIVADAIKLMKHTKGNELNINELARTLHISRTGLFHAFIKITNTSPLLCQHKIRLEKCKILIKENPHLTFAEIAELADFSDEKYFMRFFKAKSGMTPGNFRKKCREEKNFQKSI